MAYAVDVVNNLRDAMRSAAMNCDVGKPQQELERPYMVLNVLPVSINESSLVGGTQIVDLYITLSAIGANQAQSEAVMKRGLDVVASWNDPAMLGPAESSPGAHLPQEEGTWRCDATVKLRMQ